MFELADGLTAETGTDVTVTHTAHRNPAGKLDRLLLLIYSFFKIIIYSLGISQIKSAFVKQKEGEGSIRFISAALMKPVTATMSVAAAPVQLHCKLRLV